MEMQRTYYNQDIFEKKIKVDLILPDFNTYYKATVFKRVRYWWQDRQID